MKIEDLMNRSVCTCLQSDSLEHAAQIMWEADVGCLVVVDDQARPIAMLTDRDALMAAYTQGLALRDARVGSAMSHELRACAPNWTLRDVEDAMQESRIRRMPVVNAEGKLVGIVGLGDIARSTQSATHIAGIPGVAKTLACITEPRQRTATAAE